MEQEMRWAVANFVENFGKLTFSENRSTKFILLLRHNNREYLDYIYELVKGQGGVHGFDPYELHISGYKAVQFVDYLLPYMTQQQKEFQKIRNEFAKHLIDADIKKKADHKKMLDRNRR